MIVSLQESEKKLSNLLDKALAGEEVIVTRNGEPVAQIVPLAKRKKWVGMDKGKGCVPDSFQDPLEDETIDYLTGEKI